VLARCGRHTSTTGCGLACDPAQRHAVSGPPRGRAAPPPSAASCTPPCIPELHPPVQTPSGAPQLSSAERMREKPLDFLVQRFAIDPATRWRRVYALGGQVSVWFPAGFCAALGEVRAAMLALRNLEIASGTHSSLPTVWCRHCGLQKTLPPTLAPVPQEAASHPYLCPSIAGGAVGGCAAAGGARPCADRPDHGHCIRRGAALGRLPLRCVGAVRTACFSDCPAHT
jgi:hypothetical protein